MVWSVSFFVNAVLLGVGLSMDAFSVSVADGLNEPLMRHGKLLIVCGAFAFFQALMPMLGWLSVRRMLSAFRVLVPLIPWICLTILSLIGVSMLLEARKPEDTEKQVRLTPGTLLMQAVATSLDALSVGFAIAEYDFPAAFAGALIIAAVTFPVCLAGGVLGRKVGAGLSRKAMILGGSILIAVGIEIWATALFG